MGYKIFVSYKYHDSSVYPLNPYLHPFLFFNNNHKTIVRNYVDCLESYFDSTNHIYKGESDNEDLSALSEDTIWEKLKDRIYDSSVTIVMISPNMREPYISEDSQWIPWEIAYSLRETTRGDRTSHSIAILAVILPDRNNQYTYFTQPFAYQMMNNFYFYVNEDTVFSIIRNNMNNHNWKRNNFLLPGQYSISTGEESYIPSVTWDNFIKQPTNYIECAVRHKANILNYTICKEI